MPPRRVLAAFLVASLALAVAPISSAEVRFALVGHVPAVCAIDEQSVARDGGAALVDLSVRCNLPAFSVSAPGATDLSLESFTSTSAEGGAAPSIASHGATIEFAELRPALHRIRLRVTSPSPSMRLVLDAR